MRIRNAIVGGVVLLTVSLAGDAKATPTCPFSTFDEDNKTILFMPHTVPAWNALLSTNGTMTDQASWNDGEGFGTLDITKPFTKLAAAISVVGFYRYDSWWGWHPNGQYLTEGMTLDSRFHSQSHWSYNDEDKNGVEASTYSEWGVHYTQFKCPLFNDNPGTNNTSERAVTIVHEHWHLTLHDHGLNQHHRTGPIGSCMNTDASCDYYYPHLVHDYLPGGESGGDLAYFRESTSATFNGTGHALYHSAYQVGLEYACDLGQFSKPEVPKATTITATGIATGRANTNFINIVGWRCGQPLPF